MGSAPPVSDRRRNGRSERRSTAKNAHSPAADAAPSAATRQSVHPILPPSDSARISDPTPTNCAAAPRMSGAERRAPESFGARRKATEKKIAAAQIGARARKMERQPKASTSAPPPSDPATIPIVPSAAVAPSARPRNSEGKARVTSAGESAISSPLPTACSVLSPNTTLRSLDSPIATTAAVYAARPKTYMRLSPAASAAAPSASCIAALAPTYRMMIH